MPSEFENAPLVRRSWHVRRDLPAGHVITADDVIALRPETGVSVAVDIVGRATTRAVATGDALVPDAVTAG
jgi:N-acetylneuraminate synthase/N,N'-diacetyllegionaminate synthase